MRGALGEAGVGGLDVEDRVGFEDSDCNGAQVEVDFHSLMFRGPAFDVPRLLRGSDVGAGCKVERID